MGIASYVQSSFLGGEVSKSYQGRYDKQEYRTFLNVCLNALPNEQGTWQRRGGSGFAATTRNGLAGRITAFDFNQANSYNIELTNGFLRAFAGLALVTTNDDQVIVAISAANPAVVQTTTATTWATGDQAIFKLFAASCPLLQNRTFSLTKIDTTHFSLSDAITGVPIDGSTLGAPAAGATIARVLQLVSPYVGGNWASVRVVLADIPIAQSTTPGMVLLNATIKPQVLQVVTPPSGANFATFTLGAISLLDGPYLDAVTTNETISISGAAGSQTIIASGTSFGGFKSTDVGRLIRFLIEPPPFDGGLSYIVTNVVSFPPTTLTDGPQYWACTSATPTSAKPGTDTTKWIPQPVTKDLAIWSWAIITAFTSATQVTATIQVGIPIYNNVGAPGVPPTLPISLWRMGLYSDTIGWPTCGTYHEGRLWLSGALGNRIDGSKSNDPFNFAPTSIIGTVADNSAIAYRFNAPDINPVFWMHPDAQGIVCGTQAGEWLVQATTVNAILTPRSIQAHRVTKNGCANIEPRRTDHTLVVVQKFRRKILEYFADVFSAKFSARNIIEKGEHLTKSFIAELGYQQELVSTVWARMDNGALVGVTYQRSSLVSSQDPNFSAAHRHTLGSGRLIESITVGPTIGGNLEALAMVTNDPATNIRHVEVFQTMWEEGDAPGSAWLLDDAVRPTSTTTTNAASGNAPYGGMTLNGLWHLNGKTVQVFAGGLDCGNRGDNITMFTDFLVTNGSVFVPYGDGVSAGSGAGLFTAAFAAAAASAGQILVGFTYNSDGQIVRPNAPPETGAHAGPGFAKTRRSQIYGIQVYDTAGLQIGTSFAKMDPVLFKVEGGPALAAGALAQGVFRDKLIDPYSFDSMICWRASRPLPANIAAIGAMIHTQDV